MKKLTGWLCLLAFAAVSVGLISFLQLFTADAGTAGSEYIDWQESRIVSPDGSVRSFDMLSGQPELKEGEYIRLSLVLPEGRAEGVYMVFEVTGASIVLKMDGEELYRSSAVQHDGTTGLGQLQLPMPSGGGEELTMELVPLGEMWLFPPMLRLTDDPENMGSTMSYANYYAIPAGAAALATALLCGENLLLVGPKATGKNVLAECLAAAFGRPSWDISFYINTDAASLIGTDTFTGGEVSFRQGPITKCAKLGGFGILDEINMAKNESLAVLHATLDFRRIIDVPGYDRIDMDPATRFIATMNYGYAGTRELNEALVSRFAVIDMPPINAENLKKLLKREYPTLRDQWAEQFAGLFEDIRKKCDSAEISTKALDLRGLMSSVQLMHRGLVAGEALKLGVVNKAFDPFERKLVEDVITARIPSSLGRDKLFDE